MRYRRRPGEKAWHFYPSCPWWPEQNYVEEGQVPAEDERCLSRAAEVVFFTEVLDDEARRFWETEA